MNAVEWRNDSLTLNLHVQPKASRDEWSGFHGERLKLRIKAPPVDGRANDYLMRFLAAEFGVSKRACRLVSGDSSRDKCVTIDAPQQFPDFLKTHLTKN
ncbi:MAG: DUF167 family protein YggU [Methylomicrobium sp.]